MEVVLNSALSPKAREDYRLVQLAVDGDQRAYTLLLERYRAPIFHMMFKMVNNREDADDLTLEAFGKAFSKLDTYAPRYAFSTWLFKIAMNNGIDFIRKKRLTLLSIDDPIEHDAVQDYANNIQAWVLDPEEEFIRKQRLILMRHLLTRLSGKYRLMIEMRYFEDMSYEEIAGRLDIPLGTVKAQLFRAKENLYKLLQKPGAGAYLEMPQRSRVGR